MKSIITITLEKELDAELLTIYEENLKELGQEKLADEVNSVFKNDLMDALEIQDDVIVTVNTVFI